MSYRICNQSTYKIWKSNYADARVPLTDWWDKTRKADWTCYNDVKLTFNSVDRSISDKEHPRLIFDIGGNNYRLICNIDYEHKTIYLMAFWTHDHYSKVCKEKGGTLDRVYIDWEKSK